MNLALWIAAGLLATVALAGGLSKTLVSQKRLAATPGGEWTAEADPRFIKTLGVLELLAAVGLIIPAVVGIAPFMVPVTAICWIVLMVGAMVTHLRLGQLIPVMFNLTYLCLALFIAWGRLGPEPFTG